MVENKDKNKVINLLGCSWEYLPVIFDLAFETLGIQEFNIFKNIEVAGMPILNFNKEMFVYHEFNFDDFKNNNFSLITLGVTGPKAKYLVYNQFSARYNFNINQMSNLIHPASYLASSSKLKNAIIIEPGIIISSQTIIGNAVTIKRGVKIGHHNVIGDFCELNPGVITGGHVEIGKGCILGIGSVIKNNITIGSNSFIGMGSVVNNDIPEGVIAYGSPCKVVKNNDLWKI